MSYKKDAIKKLAADIAADGFRVFIAKSGEYGFYTDSDGSRIVSFQYDLGGFRFSGNYKTSAPQSTGNGWSLKAASFADMFNEYAPRWATGSATWKYTTLEQHLKTYQPSSQYTGFNEVQA